LFYRVTVRKVVVRRAAEGDTFGIARVHVEAWRVAYRGLVPDAELDGISVRQRERDWHEILATGDEPSFTLVAIADGRLVGFCSCAVPSRDDDASDRTAEVAAIYVAPTEWRSGVGRILLSRAVDELRDGGWQDVTLWVFAENRPARAFYSSFGFQPDGEEMDRDRSGQIEVRLRTSLTA
jgi:GNAT superfamily N-acetyltransferase